MGLSNPDNDKHSRHSMVVVPLYRITIKRMLMPTAILMPLRPRGDAFR